MMRRAPPSTASSESAKGDEAVASTPNDKTTIREALSHTTASSSVRLAYAATDDGALGNPGRNITSRYDQWTAVYDISARTVYMPDGTSLEAHSGLAASLDDPAEVDEKDRGSYTSQRLQSRITGNGFPRVRALRLIPVDDQKTFGRTDLLAHSFMLGPNGDSNGCVSFRD